MNKFKLIAVLLGGMLLTGCERSTEDITDDFRLPRELKECTIHRLTNANLRVLYVVHCPGKNVTNTAFTTGKTKNYVALVDDE